MDALTGMPSVTADPDRTLTGYTPGRNNLQPSGNRDQQPGIIPLTGIKPQVVAPVEASADRFVINVSGLKFETHVQTLDQPPGPLYK